MIFYIEDLKLM